MKHLLRTKPVTLLAIAHAIMGVALAFELVTWSGGQLAAVEGLFAALGFTAAGQVTANARLDPAVVAAAKGADTWTASLTDDPPAPPPDDEV